MRGVFFLGALLTFSVFAWGAEPPPATSTPERVERLVKQLGSSKFSEREKAQHALEAIGVPALELLRKAVKSEDQETSRRAGELVQKLDAVILAAKVLAPKRVRLDLQDSSVLAAVAELQRQSGYRIHVAGNRAALANRKVTLATGDVSFWEGFDALCRKGRLVEVLADVLPGGAVPVQVAQAVPQVGPVSGLQTYPSNAQIIVKDGTPVAMATCYAGAMRIRARATTSLPGYAGDAVVTLELSPEPRLERLTIDGSPIVRKAFDEIGRKLELISTDSGGTVSPGHSFMVTARLKLGDKQASTLKQLQGTLTVKTLTAVEPLVVVDNFQKAAGRTVKGKDGGSLQIMAIDLLPNGDIQTQVRMINLAVDKANLPAFGQVQFQQIQVQGQQIIVQIGGPGRGFGGRRRFQMTNTYQGALPSLVDNKGESFQVVQIPQRRVQANNTGLLEEVTMIFRPRRGQGEPARLVLSCQRLVTIPVAFNLSDVPLR